MTQRDNISIDNHQIILLDRKGRVRYSCETLINLHGFKENSVVSAFPILESIFPHILTMGTKEKPLRYNRLEYPVPGLSGSYDFTFQWAEIHDGDYILWNIYDRSELYKNLKKAQQRRNEQAIIEERLSHISQRELEEWK
ncbi:MAG: hypothetical protein HKN16_06125 [Saprospiraceae bacterium]|nr:hypothetical protein [Saprospiraceae bacterium]